MLCTWATSAAYMGHQCCVHGPPVLCAWATRAVYMGHQCCVHGPPVLCTWATSAAYMGHQCCVHGPPVLCACKTVFVLCPTAQQEAQRAQFLVERAIQQKQEKIVKAEGEAKAATLISSHSSYFVLCPVFVCPVCCVCCVCCVPVSCVCVSSVLCAVSSVLCVLCPVCWCCVLCVLCLCVCHVYLCVVLKDSD